MDTKDIQEAIKILEAQLKSAIATVNDLQDRMAYGVVKIKYLEKSIAQLRENLSACIHCGQPEGSHAQKDDACPTSDFYSDSQRFEVRQ